MIGLLIGLLLVRLLGLLVGLLILVIHNRVYVNEMELSPT